MRAFISFILLISAFGPQSSPAQLSNKRLDPFIESKIDSLIAIMTLEEKLGQLNQINGTWDSATGTHLNAEETEALKAGKIGSFLGIAGAAETGRIQRIAVEQSRLGIPVLFGLDIIHGYSTIFPIPLAEASSWDPDLVQRSAHIAAVEGSAAGLHWTFAPMVDIARDPRWGRIAEGSGEDPYLGSAMAAARVRGFQGKDLHAFGSLLACAKHFAAYGGAEGGRDYNTVDVSERTLREVYLPPFKAAVDAGAWTLMSSFNEISGIPSSANRWLMTDLLRDEWGFKGFVISDYTAVMELTNHRIAASKTDAGVAALTAGVDIDMMSRIYVDSLPNAVRSGALPMSVVDEAVRRVLRVKFAYGLFDDPYRNSHPEKEKELILTPEHRKAARTMADESIVLLKNDKNILPLSKKANTIALIGPLAGNENRGDLIGTWAWVKDPSVIIPVLDGVKEQAGPGTHILYDKGCELIADSGYRAREALRIAQKADIIVAVMGEPRDMSGEAASRTDIGLPGMQQELLKALVRTGKPLVLVVMSGRPLTLLWESEHIPAIIQAWHLGVETGHAVADVLFGDVVPSGKLPVSFPRSVGQIPVYYNHKSTGRPFDAEEKYTSRYLDAPNEPLYPFGFGLSYTTFSYSSLTLLPSLIKVGDSVKVSVQVKNDGQRAGSEIVQMYLQDVVSTVTRPVKELKGFKKITLKPGESRTVSFTVTPDAMSFYNKEMKKVTEPGSFNVFVGGSSVEGLEALFSVTP